MELQVRIQARVVAPMLGLAETMHGPVVVGAAVLVVVDGPVDLVVVLPAAVALGLVVLPATTATLQPREVGAQRTPTAQIQSLGRRRRKKTMPSFSGSCARWASHQTRATRCLPW